MQFLHAFIKLLHISTQNWDLTHEQVIPNVKRKNLITDFIQQNFFDSKKVFFCDRIFQVSRELQTKTKLHRNISHI